MYFSNQVEGEIGRVCKINSPSTFYVHFDNEEINKWFDEQGGCFTSSWFERVEMCVDKELDELASKTASLFYDAVRKGDLRTVGLLINRHGVDVNSLCFNDMTALHLAIKEGQKEIVEFLLNLPQTDLEKRGSHVRYRAIHYAVLRY